jgi:hypothetical protein
MSVTSKPTTVKRRIARVAAASALVGLAGIGLAQPAVADTPVTSALPAPYNNCPGAPCITLATIDTSGSTVKFRGETRDVTEGSQWYLTVRRGDDVVKTYASDYLAKNRLDADLGALAPGRNYQLTVLAGTPYGDQLLNRSFTTGPAVTAPPTATNVSLAFTMPVGVSANASIRKADGTIVATASSAGTAKSHILTTAAVLNPTTSYTYQVNATDAQGRVYTKVGSFLTRNVRLEVKLSGLQISNDSDTFGAGELRAQLHVGGTKRWIWQSAKSVETAWGAKYFPLTTDAALPSAVRNVPISVVVSDDDCEGIGSLCTSGGGDLTLGSGTVSDHQWATATVTASLPNTTATTGWTSFLQTVNSPVGFTVTGSYRWVMV